MAGTNRKEMRKLLNKYIALMKVAFDNGINFDLTSRLDREKDLPWLTGYVYEEGCKFDDESQNGVRFLNFCVYDFLDVEENWERVKLVEKFIEEHKK